MLYQQFAHQSDFWRFWVGWGGTFFFGKYLGSASAAPTKILLLRARFQRAIGLGRGISRPAPPGAICLTPIARGAKDNATTKRVRPMANIYGTS
jgi:hypothetical protein